MFGQGLPGGKENPHVLVTFVSTLRVHLTPREVGDMVSDVSVEIQFKGAARSCTVCVTMIAQMPVTLKLQPPTVQLTEDRACLGPAS